MDQMMQFNLVRMYDLPGERAVLEALLLHHSSGEEAKGLSYNERYNALCKIIYGDNAPFYQIRRSQGRQKYPPKNGYPFDAVLVDMYEAYKKGKYKNMTHLAREFVDKITYGKNGREQAVVRLRYAYSKMLPKLKIKKNRDEIRYWARFNDLQKGWHDRELMNENEVKLVLRDFGWAFYDDYYEEENEEAEESND